jgi:arylsulfatase A-like enzyme
VRGVTYLGPAEVRSAAWLASRPERRVEHLAAGEIRALRQAAGTGAAWRVELGRSPYLTFVPLRDSARPCSCEQRVEVREAGRPPVEVYRAAPAAAEPYAPAAAFVDLGRWAGRSIELVLSVVPAGPAPIPAADSAGGFAGRAAGGAAGRALWGSPALLSRGARPVLPAAGPLLRPSVLLLGIDTLRADALGAYGRTPSVTPALDRLAAGSDVWLDAFSCFNVTNPSFASLLTGLYGKNHGVYDFETPLPRDRFTLAEAFAQAGYDTRAILSIDHLQDSQSGLGQGFGEVTVAREQLAAETSVDLAIDWLGTRQRPFFLWLHLFDPHTPHTPPAPFAEGFRPPAPTGLLPPRPAGAWVPFRVPGAVSYRNEVLGGAAELYAGEVAYLDRQLDRLLGYLESRGLLASTLVVLIADHGENLEDHGVSYRHAGLWDTTTHVPLLIRWPGPEYPGRTGRRLRGLVQNVDVFPTLLGAAGLPVPAQDGRDLRSLTGPGKPGRRLVFAEHTGQLGAMVRSAGFKYMTSHGNRLVPDGAYLYDLRRDPGELHNLAGSGLQIEGDLAALLAHWLADRRVPGAAATPRRDLSAEEVARLKALGYL